VCNRWVFSFFWMWESSLLVWSLVTDCSRRQGHRSNKLCPSSLHDSGSCCRRSETTYCCVTIIKCDDFPSDTPDSNNVDSDASVSLAWTSLCTWPAASAVASTQAWCVLVGQDPVPTVQPHSVRVAVVSATTPASTASDDYDSTSRADTSQST